MKATHQSNVDQLEAGYLQTKLSNVNRLAAQVTNLTCGFHQKGTFSENLDIQDLPEFSLIRCIFTSRN